MRHLLALAAIAAVLCFRTAVAEVALGPDHQAGRMEAERVVIAIRYGPETAGRLGVEVEITAPGRTEPLHLSISLADGDRIALALPGHPEVRYHFARRGGMVKGWSERVEFVEIAQIE